jgi:uncharacterized membrane protein (DUF373 family)
VATRQQSIIQITVVILIALPAIARKFMILDLHIVNANQAFGLAAATLGLGVSYWFVKASGKPKVEGAMPDNRFQGIGPHRGPTPETTKR